ncbi:hypothetical protein SAMN02799633_01953 [Bacillus sp. UNCCL81]|nr:hypothetical protein SAMN02799633_01953 [Bacillus sp. UNCCL81]
MNTQKKIQKSQKNNIVFQGSGIVVPNLEGCRHHFGIFVSYANFKKEMDCF